jgi:hypothetical protein
LPQHADFSLCWGCFAMQQSLGLLGRAGRSFERLLSRNPEANIQFSLYLKMLKGQSYGRF